MRLVVAFSGKGLLIGVKLLQVVRRLGVETHLVLDNYTEEEVSTDTGLSRLELSSLADYTYSNNDLTAPIASGSYPIDGMIITPCSLKRVSDLAQGYASDLIGRAADVTLKECRTLVLSINEAPLSLEDVRNLIILAEAGATIVPAIPLFYTGVEDVNRALDEIIGRILDRFNLQHSLYKPWGGKVG